MTTGWKWEPWNFNHFGYMRECKPGEKAEFYKAEDFDAVQHRINKAPRLGIDLRTDGGLGIVNIDEIQLTVGKAGVYRLVFDGAACRYPACLVNEDGKCGDWLIGDCPGPKDEP